MGDVLGALLEALFGWGGPDPSHWSDRARRRFAVIFLVVLTIMSAVLVGLLLTTTV